MILNIINIQMKWNIKIFGQLIPTAMNIFMRNSMWQIKNNKKHTHEKSISLPLFDVVIRRFGTNCK